MIVFERVKTFKKVNDNLLQQGRYQSVNYYSKRDILRYIIIARDKSFPTLRGDCFYNICLKTLLQQGISDPVFYGNLVYKFKIIVGKPKFSDRFKTIIKCNKRVVYNVDIMR